MGDLRAMRAALPRADLTLTHEGFPSTRHRDLAGGGWPGFLDRIEALVR